MSDKIYAEWHKEVETAFPDLTFKRLQGGGFNVYLPDRVLSFWFKKHKFGDNRTGQWQKFSQINTISEIVKIINLKLSKDTPPSKPNVIKRFEDKGTQACIDHVVRKLARYRELNPTKAGNETACMLLMISEELKQYL